MSGFGGNQSGQGTALLTTNAGSVLGTELTQLLMADAIQPGSEPSYPTCKTIYLFHPLGAKMADSPINMAQSQAREITVPNDPGDRVKEAFIREWSQLGCDAIIHNVMKTSRIYGIASLVAGAQGVNPEKPLPLEKLHKLDLYFNVLDPLNTAGSQTLDQNPNSPDYQKPTYIVVNGAKYHSSRSVVVMNEEPVYIAWSNSSFGYVGRSVYQRALYPLKSFVQSMITDDMVTQKAGVLVAKMKMPGSIADGFMSKLLGIKRGMLQASTTNNVLSVGHEESIESLNMQNLEGAAKFARDNILKNIATAAGMPASMLNQETLAEGFGEGVEDAKQIARYIDRVRVEMGPLYRFFDQIVQHRAWSPDFYSALQNDFPEFRKLSYAEAFYGWKNGFKSSWPNLLVEPDSDKARTEEVRFKSVVALLEVMLPQLDPENKAKIMLWAADNCNERRELFSTPLLLDGDAIANYTPPSSATEPHSEPFSYET